MGLKVIADAQQGGPARFLLQGVLDERVDVDRALAAVRSAAVLDLGGVERVNSVGVLRWLRWIVAASRAHPLELERIPYVFAVQAGQVAHLFGSALLRSCLGPYYCPTCRANHQLEVTAAEARSAAPRPPPKRCPCCGGALEFDDVEGFFSFMTGRTA